MKRAALIILGLLMVLAGWAYWHNRLPAPKEEGVARLKATAAQPLPNPPLGAAFIEQSADVSRLKPDSISDLPREIYFGNPLYFEHKIHNVSFAGIIYREKEQWTIYADTNLNGRLSDEKAITGQPSKLNEYRTDHVFGPVWIDNPAVSPFYLVYSGYTYIRLYPAIYRTGNIQLQSGVYQVALLDGDFDNKYATLFTPQADSTLFLNCDVLAIDSNRDKVYSREEMLPLSRYVRIGKICYEVMISHHGERLELLKASPALGKLKIGGQKRYRCLLYSGTMSGPVDFVDELELPAGEYSARYGFLHIKNTEGAEWRFAENGFEQHSALKQFAITAGQINEQPLGPPFKILTLRDYRKSGEITFRVSLEGAGGETYSARIYKNGISPPAPLVKIVDEQGRMLHSGSMEYG